MCVCSHCEETTKIKVPVVSRGKSGLFNKMTVLLLSGWILIVAMAMESAQEKKNQALTKQSFVQELLR